MADINNGKDQKWACMTPYLTRDDNGRQILPAQIRPRQGRQNEERTKARYHEYWFCATNLRISRSYDPDVMLSEHYSPGREIY